MDCVFYWNSNGMDRRGYSRWYDSGPWVPSVEAGDDQSSPLGKYCGRRYPYER